MSFLSNKKLRKYWHDRVTQLILDLGATPVYHHYDPTSLNEYHLNSSVGLVTIHPPSPDSEFISICSRFKDVEAANAKFGSRGWHHNQHSGKYNIHPSVADGVKPCDRIPYIDSALEDVKKHFESVL